MSTRGLSIPHIAPSQSNKIGSVNAALDLLDGALTQQSVIDVSGNGDVEPTPAQVLPFMALRLVGTLTANVNLILPSSAHLYVLKDETSGGSPPYTITAKCGAGTTIVLNSGDVKIIFCDGTNVVAPN